MNLADEFHPCPKPEPSCLRKKAMEREAQKAWEACKRRVRHRDGNRCRLCCRPMYPDPHHIIPKSLGGRDVDSNIVCLCREHHDWIKAGLLRIDGNPEVIGGLTFVIDARVSKSGQEETVTR